METERKVFVGQYHSVFGAASGLGGAAMRSEVTWGPLEEMWYRNLRTWDPRSGARPSWLAPHVHGISPRGGLNAPYQVVAGSKSLEVARAVAVHLDDGTTLTNATSVARGRSSLLYDPTHGFGERFVLSPDVFKTLGGEWLEQGDATGIQAHMSRMKADLAARGLNDAASHVAALAETSAARDFENLLIGRVPARAIRTWSVYVGGRIVRVLGGLGIVVIAVDQAVAVKHSLQRRTIAPLAWATLRNGGGTGIGAGTSWLAMNYAAPLLGLTGAAPIVLAVGGSIVIASLFAWGIGKLEGESQ